MTCIQLEVELTDGISAEVELSSGVELEIAVEQETLELDAGLEEEIELVLEVTTGGIDLCVDFADFGNRTELCPIITCIDGGAPDTTSYPAINGFLNGGSP